MEMWKILLHFINVHYPYCVVLFCRVVKDKSNSSQLGFGQFSETFCLHFFTDFSDLHWEGEKWSTQGDWEEVPLPSCFPAGQPPARTAARAYSSSVQDFTFLFVELYEFLATHFSMLSRSLWMAAQTSGPSAATPPSFVFFQTCWPYCRRLSGWSDMISPLQLHAYHSQSPSCPSDVWKWFIWLFAPSPSQGLT